MPGFYNAGGEDKETCLCVDEQVGLLHQKKHGPT